MFEIYSLFMLIMINSSFGRPVNNTSLSSANNRFSLQLLQHLFDEHKNVFFSPFSISSAFGMLYSGANGVTAEEMREVLGYESQQLSDQQINEDFSHIINEIQTKKSKSYELNVANRIYVQKESDILETFQQNLEKYFKSSAEEVDFASDPKAIMVSINEWVAKQTHDKIKEILSKPLDSTTRVVILNAVYFKGVFQSKFKKDQTHKAVFFNWGNVEKRVQFMRKTDKFNFTEIPEIDSKLLEIPYSGDDISLYIVLPNQRQGLKELNHNLKDIEIIEKSITKLRVMEVEVKVPKFKIETSYSLKRQLSEMGMKSVFTMKADLSKINGNTNLYVSEVIHKAFIEVNEEGTEAAAVTAIKIQPKSIHWPPNKRLFKADHPFMFLIRNNRNGMILFSGYINDL